MSSKQPTIKVKTENQDNRDEDQVTIDGYQSLLRDKSKFMNEQSKQLAAERLEVDSLRRQHNEFSFKISKLELTAEFENKKKEFEIGILSLEIEKKDVQIKELNIVINNKDHQLDDADKLLEQKDTQISELTKNYEQTLRDM